MSKLGILLLSSVIFFTYLNVGAETPMEKGQLVNISGTPLYLPANIKPNAELIVYLHGCNQSEQDAMDVTRLNEWADRRGFAVLYPRQSIIRNPFLCWSWYKASEARRGGHEAQAMIVDVVKAVQEKYNLNKDKTFVLGLSAGGAMTQLLMACYPDVFAAGASHSGVAYVGEAGSAEPLKLMAAGSPDSNVELAQKALDCIKSSGWQKPIPMMFVSGKADDRVSYKNSLQSLAQMVLSSDMITNGQWRDNPEQIKPKKEEKFAKQGDQYAYSMCSYAMSSGPSSKLLLVNGLNHAWSGGPSDKPYSDNRGPDATKMILDFFAGIR